MFLQHIVCHVTQLVDRSGWQPRLALRALAWWRWRTCMGLAAMVERAGRGPSAAKVPARPRKLPVH